MILDNLSRAFKTQNWLAAVIEFVIVIAGVVVGFQINAWAGMRADAEHKAALLDRLHDEVEDGVGVIRRVVGYYDEANFHRTEVIERLIAQDFEGMDEEAMIDGVISTTLLPSYSAREAVYTEIVSSGMLSGLGDAQFRETLGEYRSRVTFLRGQIDYMRDTVNNRSEMYQTAHVSQVYDPGTPRQRRYVVDWPTAAADPDFLQLLLAGNNTMIAIAGWWEETLNQAEALCAETARLTGRPCEPS